ncbi:flagellar export protein FliJ [Alloalcanivorax mobilis]|uniref:flagellar export protein FliJ n=1 Tax=Alloalcanivorax mobilis TaxID=2019569 RepID=UPI000C75C596|nr:flagellar export protein FliJ [Alloalcanivorax mobilis]
MSASTPLDLLIEQSRKARDHAGRSLADERRGEARAAAQLDTLHQYRGEYCRRLQDAMNNGIDAASLANYQGFIRSLDDAIERARAALADQGERVSASQHHWQQQQHRLSSYDTLATRRSRQQRQAQERQEQRHNDEQTNNTLARQRLEKHRWE